MAAADDSRADDEVYHRDNIFEFFRNHTAYDMLPESGKTLQQTICSICSICSNSEPLA